MITECFNQRRYKMKQCFKNYEMRIPLALYIKLQHEDCSIDCCDTEIDAMICIETDIDSDPEYPLLEQCILKLYELIDVVRVGDPIMLDITGLLHHNKEACREWIKDNWKPKYHSVIDEDDGEWEYQFVCAFNNILIGNAGEATGNKYLKLLSQFERVPALSNTLVIVPAHQTVDFCEGKCVCVGGNK